MPCYLATQFGFLSNHEDGRWGVVTLLEPCWKIEIFNHGEDPMHILVWILMKIDNQPFGIINIYAPNDVVERNYLWHWIDDWLPSATWVMCGDFNLVEVAFDKDGTWH